MLLNEVIKPLKRGRLNELAHSDEITGSFYVPTRFERVL